MIVRAGILQPNDAIAEPGRNWRLAVRTIWRYRGVGRRLASVSGAA